jgi:hypothetical protein
VNAEPTTEPPPLEFATEQEAWDWLTAEVDDPYQDNERLAYLDDPEGMARYDKQDADGCCGSLNYDVVIAGRPARIGCNFGH